MRRVFLSYSGARSAAVAEALSDFLNCAVPELEILRAPNDMAVGTPWLEHLRRDISGLDVAILCVTAENATRPWLVYESGVISQLAKRTVCYLFGLNAEQLPSPLAAFESVTANRSGTLQLARSLAFTPSSTLDLQEGFTPCWEQFASVLAGLEGLNSPPDLSVAFRDTQTIQVAAIEGQVGMLDKMLIGPLHEAAATQLTVTAAKSITSDEAYQRINAAVRQNLDQLKLNVEQARIESRQFFRLTVLFVSLGFSVVIVGVILLLLKQTTAGIVATMASTIPEATAVLFFRKDTELRKMIEGYHGHMLKSQQMLTMIDVCETIGAEAERDRMKQQIIFKGLDIACPPQ